MTAATASSIQYLNLAYFGRPSDPAALDAYPASGMSQEAIVANFVSTAEYTTNTITPNSSANPGGGRTFDTTSLINTFYQRLVGRLASAVEVAGWSTALAQGTVDENYLGITILNAWLNLPAATADRQVLVAKFDSAQLWTGDLYNNPASANAYSTTAAVNSGIAFANGITTATAATAAEAAAAVTTMVADSGSSGGSSFTLTTTPDTVTGNISSINGVTVNAGAGSTLNVFDTINVSPSNGLATANINMAGTAMAMTGANVPILNGVTTINLNNQLGVNSIATNSITPNATTINANILAGAGATTNALNGVGAAIVNFGQSGAATAASNYVVTFAVGTRTANTDAATFTIANNITAAGLNIGNFDTAGAAGGQGIDILNVVATGSNRYNRFQIRDNAATQLRSLSLTGAGSLIVDTALAFRGTTSVIDASQNTGGFDLGITGASTSTITGGSGNDVIRFATAGAFNAADTLDLGTGTNTLFLADLALGTGASAALNTAVNAATSATRLGVSANATFNFSRLTANTVLLGAGTTTVAQQVTATDNIRVEGVTAAQVTAAATLGFNTVNLAVQGSVNNVAGVLTTAVLTGQATVNISSGSDGANNITNTIGTLTNAAAAAITITGDQALTITNALGGTAAVNASALTGALTIISNAAGASSVTGGTANDTITGGAAADTLIGGAGVDTITTGAANANGLRLQGGLGADVINISDGVAVASRTSTLVVTAADSFATAGSFDTITIANATNNADRIITTATGVTATTVAAATTVALGTTTVTANGFFVVNAAGSAAAQAQNASVYQDSNGNGVIDATDMQFNIARAGTETLSFGVVGGQLAIGFLAT